ncbi:unnamed protein product [Ceutorhynchus assimilis]|uniref:Uncharacterized protein n=1 Tax=Ceutorhynchus assimilis TaxID=467358 RepID=A0A9N9MBP4_9CUCU|nr:unnamed protein product [Ceutorhynchus assimilis]
MDYTENTMMDYAENTTSLFTDLEEDPFNPYEYEMSTQEKNYHFVIEYLATTIHMLLCVAILLASSLFFYAFCKFKNLQTRTNYILLHFYICITTSSVLFTIILILEMIIVVFSNHRGIMVLMVLTFGFVNASLVLALLLAQDWILSASNTRFAQKCQDCYKWMIGSVYLLILSHFIFFFIGSHHDEAAAMSAGSCCLVYLINGIVLIVFNVIRYKKTFSEESKQILYALNVASVYYLMSLPPLCFVLLGIVVPLQTGNSYDFIAIMACITYFLEFISFSAPVVIVYLLPRWDKNFKMAFDQVFKSAIRKYQQVDNNLEV